jgi:hypothetical protein
VRDQIRAGDANNNPVGQPNHHWGDSEERNLLSFVNATFPLDAANTRFLYAFGGASQRDGSHGGFYRRALDARNWPQIYPQGFLPTIQPDVDGRIGHGRRARGPRGGVVLRRVRRPGAQPVRLHGRQQPERVARPERPAQPDRVRLGRPGLSTRRREPGHHARASTSAWPAR